MGARIQEVQKAGAEPRPVEIQFGSAKFVEPLLRAGTVSIAISR